MTDIILGFGRHKGSNLQTVFEYYPEYSRWLYNQELILKAYPNIRSFLDKKLKNSDMTYLINFGKYKNRTIKWVRINDKRYYDWLMNNPKFDNFHEMKAAMKELNEANRFINVE